MRILTWNVNGLRAAIRKGFADHLTRLKPDVVLLQEVRALPEQLPVGWDSPKGWEVIWHPAEKKGYAGTAVWSRFPMEEVGRGILKRDPEGRVLRVRIEGIQLISVYLPSGSSGEERQKRKETWMKSMLPWTKKLVGLDEPVVMGGDFNIAHTEKDIFYAKGNEKNSGFLPHERRWMGRLLKSGWSDYVREHYGDIQGSYSWWSNRGRARELDRGWRIDYLLGNESAAARFRFANVDREGGLTISDHAPVIIELA